MSGHHKWPPIHVEDLPYRVAEVRRERVFRDFLRAELSLLRVLADRLEQDRKSDKDIYQQILRVTERLDDPELRDRLRRHAWRVETAQADLVQLLHQAARSPEDLDLIRAIVNESRD